MKKQIADRWVAALRSGTYTQDSGQLRSTIGMCCLGVLCDLYAPKAWQTRTLGGDYYYQDTLGELPQTVRKWAGLTSVDGALPDEAQDGNLHSLADLNDDGTTFAEIADIIETHYKSL